MLKFLSSLLTRRLELIGKRNVHRGIEGAALLPVVSVDAHVRSPKDITARGSEPESGDVS